MTLDEFPSCFSSRAVLASGLNMLFLALPCLALSSTSRPHNFSRRGALGVAGGAALGTALPAQAVEEEDVQVYFGAGCFWHVQHEFVLKEAAELGRSGAAFSAVTGYAGGTGTERGLVCYHNGRGVSDYGRLGHAEAVQVGPAPPLAMAATVAPTSHTNHGRAALRRSRFHRAPCRRLPASSSASSAPVATATTHRRARGRGQGQGLGWAGVDWGGGRGGGVRSWARAKVRAENGYSDWAGTGVGVRAGAWWLQRPSSPHPP